MAGWAERVAFTSGIGLFYQSDRRQAKAATPGVCPQPYPVRHSETIRPVSRRGRFTPRQGKGGPNEVCHKCA